MATDTTLDLSKLAKYFSDEDAARALLEEMRWGKTPTCPHCGGVSPYRLIARKPGSKTRKGLWKCSACRKQFTVTVGTVFEDSRIPISKWLLAIHLLSSSKKGMSAHQIHRMLGISYKAAWFMMHRLRYAMKAGPLADLLAGTVEVDETYVGARFKRGTKRGRPSVDSHKTPVVALVERGSGRVRAFATPRVTADTLWSHISGNMNTKATMMTDELASYGGLVANHETVKHRDREYVRGAAHTNTVEGFFSLLKRGITGSYHHVSRGHLQRYCDEFAFRYEHRKTSDGQRAALLVEAAEGKRLTYKQPAAS
jgi:transposase-like protein